MKAIRFVEQNSIVGMDQGAKYYPLPVQFIMDDEGPKMKTAWQPTEDEIRMISDGHLIIVEILGQQHPPIRLGVSNEPGQISARD